MQRVASAKKTLTAWRDAEKFSAEDEVQREALNLFVYGLKDQSGDQEGLGGKILDEDKKTILSTFKDTTDWTEEQEDLEEKLAAVQGVVNPITSTLYSGGATHQSHGVINIHSAQ